MPFIRSALRALRRPHLGSGNSNQRPARFNPDSAHITTGNGKVVFGSSDGSKHDRCHGHRGSEDPGPQHVATSRSSLSTIRSEPSTGMKYARVSYTFPATASDSPGARNVAREASAHNRSATVDPDLDKSGSLLTRTKRTSPLSCLRCLLGSTITLARSWNAPVVVASGVFFRIIRNKMPEGYLLSVTVSETPQTSAYASLY